jgi:hypothetical protein
MKKMKRLIAATLIALCMGPVSLTHAANTQSHDDELSRLSKDTRAWVIRSCPEALGPSLWSSCIARETAAAARGKPDLSHLKPELRSWVIRSCPDSLGPFLAISCLTRELKALANARLNTSALTDQQKRWIASACPSSLGPSLYISCFQRESATVHGASNPQPEPPIKPSSRHQKPYIAERGSSVRTSYQIEVAHNDELFVINGEKFEAQTYCLGWEEGDDVLFLDGSPFGACASAKLFNLRTREECSLWCE